MNRQLHEGLFGNSFSGLRRVGGKTPVGGRRLGSRTDQHFATLRCIRVAGGSPPGNVNPGNINPGNINPGNINPRDIKLLSAAGPIP